MDKAEHSEFVIDDPGNVAAGAADEDYSDWGVDGPLDNLADDLDLEENYPDHFGGAEFFYDENYLEVGWKGEVPQALAKWLSDRGQTDWVRFTPVPYNSKELYEAAETLMDRLTDAGVQCHSASSLDDGTAAFVRFYDHPPGTCTRAEAIAAEVSEELGLPTRAIVTTQALSRLVPAALRYFEPAADEEPGQATD